MRDESVCPVSGVDMRPAKIVYCLLNNEKNILHPTAKTELFRGFIHHIKNTYLHLSFAESYFVLTSV